MVKPSIACVLPILAGVVVLRLPVVQMELEPELQTGMYLEPVQEYQTHLGQEQEFQKEMNQERVPSRTRMPQERVLRSLQK